MHSSAVLLVSEPRLNRVVCLYGGREGDWALIQSPRSRRVFLAPQSPKINRDFELRCKYVLSLMFKRIEHLQSSTLGDICRAVAFQAFLQPFAPTIEGSDENNLIRPRPDHFSLTERSHDYVVYIAATQPYGIVVIQYKPQAIEAKTSAPGYNISTLHESKSASEILKVI